MHTPHTYQEARHAHVLLSVKWHEVSSCYLHRCKRAVYQTFDVAVRTNVIEAPLLWLNIIRSLMSMLMAVSLNFIYYPSMMLAWVVNSVAQSAN